MRKSFILKTEYDEKLSTMTDEEFGYLMRRIFEYIKTEKVPRMRRDILMVFNIIKVDLDNNEESYQKRVKANKNNGKKGGRPPKQNNPMGFEKPTETQLNPKNLDSDSDYDTLNNSKELFERVYIPTLEEIEKYCLEVKSSVNAKRFLEYNNARNWQFGNGQAISDWKALLRAWTTNEKDKPLGHGIEPEWLHKDIEEETMSDEELAEFERQLDYIKEGM